MNNQSKENFSFKYWPVQHSTLRYLVIFKWKCKGNFSLNISDSQAALFHNQHGGTYT